MSAIILSILGAIISSSSFVIIIYWATFLSPLIILVLAANRFSKSYIKNDYFTAALAINIILFLFIVFVHFNGADFVHVG